MLYVLYLIKSCIKKQKQTMNRNKDWNKLAGPSSISFSDASMAYLSHHLQHASTLPDSPNNPGWWKKQQQQKKQKKPTTCCDDKEDRFRTYAVANAISGGKQKWNALMYRKDTCVHLIM